MSQDQFVGEYGYNTSPAPAYGGGGGGGGAAAADGEESNHAWLD